MSNHGLRGHETVIRLVGKRRKLTLSAISPASTSVSRDAIKHEGDGASFVASDGNNNELDVKIQSTVWTSIAYSERYSRLQNGVGEASGLAANPNSAIIHQDGLKPEQKVGHINWVKCPICEKSIRGDVINTHLDVCLQGGVKEVKKKSKQLTMSQFGGSTYVGRLADQSSSLGFQRMTTDENHTNFKSVKIETQVNFAHPKPTNGGDTCRDGKEQELMSVKVEDNGTVALSEAAINNPDPKGIRQTRMRLKRHTRKDSPEELCFPSIKEEPGHQVHQNGGSGCLEIRPEETSWKPEKDTSLDTFGEGSVASDLVPQDCSCHCHLPALDGEDMANGSIDKVHMEDHILGEEGSDGSKGSIGEKTDSVYSVEAEPLDPSDIHSSSVMPENEKLVGVLDTKIVGRRYNRGTTCKMGMKVALLREPDNPMDANAIKVVEFPRGLSFGHLPREISLHLSSLLDKGLLRVWGKVTAVPAPVFGAVSVKLFCESRHSLKEDFFKLDGVEESLQDLLDAAENSSSLQLPFSGTVSKYQENFLYILQMILERDSHLFKDQEKAFLESFKSLSDDAQRLFIRLYQRKGPWFRLSTIEYKDVADVGVASEELLAAGYMDTQDSPNEAPNVGMRKRLEVLSVAELRQFVCDTFMKKKSEAAAAKKDVLINMVVSEGMQKHGNLIPESSGQSCLTLLEMLTEVSGKCIRVSDMADFLLWRLKRLFFLNGDTDLSTFLVVDLGLVKYPTYRCWRERNIFDTHEALLAYEQALEVAQGMDMALECNDTVTALMLLERACHQMRLDDSTLAGTARTPTFLARFSASYVYRNVCTLGVSILERKRRYSEAVDILRQLLSNKTIKSGRWGYWTVRLSVNLDHLRRKEESLQVAEEGVNDPWIRGGDLVALQRRVVRLGRPPRRWKKPPYAAALKRICKEVQIQGRPLNCVTGMRSWFYGYDGQQCRVEELALQFFASEEGGGWQGVHCEGGVWMTFFGLLMWDVLFSDVPDVFQTPFQTSPLDLDTEVFFPARQSLIEAQLAAIAEGDIEALLANTWTRHKGTMCRGVNWERHSLEELQTIALCIGGPGLSTICKLLAEDHAGWTAGMPDLLLWRTPNSSNSKEVSTDNIACTECSCNQPKRLSASTSQETSTMEYNACQREENLDNNGCGSGDGLNISKAFIKELANTRKSRKHGEAKLVEVKGPRDHLSEQQRAWIWILMNAGLTVEVCKVLEEPIE
ncbi:unnamed protein product [Calypogeia fissa]